jgi:hypothetical protein
MSSVFPSPPSPPPSVVIEGVEVLDGAAVGRHGQVADNGKEDDQGNSHKNVGEHLCENLQENRIDSKKALRKEIEPDRETGRHGERKKERKKER